MMQITIDTNEELTELDQHILQMVLGGEVILGEVAETEPEPEPPAKKAAAPAKKAAAKKAAPKPEPAAEEPVEEDDDLIGDDEAGDDEYDDVSDEDLLELAVKKATEMVAGGEAAKVREALDAAGASRVRELNTDNVREFFKALS
jgi:hypothetical protein